MRKFVMISAAKSPYFGELYLGTKTDAETYLTDACPHLNATIIRSGFIVDEKHRWWSFPLKYVNDFIYTTQENVFKKLFSKKWNDHVDQFFPAPST